MPVLRSSRTHQPHQLLETSASALAVTNSHLHGCSTTVNINANCWNQQISAEKVDRDAVGIVGCRVPSSWWCWALGPADWALYYWKTQIEGPWAADVQVKRLERTSTVITCWGLPRLIMFVQ